MELAFVYLQEGSDKTLKRTNDYKTPHLDSMGYAQRVHSHIAIQEMSVVVSSFRGKLSDFLARIKAKTLSSKYVVPRA